MTPAEALTARLGGRWYGGERYGACRCMVHDDRDPSLTIRDGTNGILIKCHAGCAGQAVIDELKRRNWWAVDPAPTAPTRSKRSAEDTRQFVRKVWRSCRPAEG